MGSVKVWGLLLPLALSLGACGRNSSAAFTGPWFDA
jgi:hypothetical protein